MNLSKIMAATLEQFNEEVLSKISENVEYDEAELGCEWGVEELKNFITQKLITHKELILKMVREKVPTHSMTRDYESTLRNRWREEFLNNLDTI